MNEPCYIEQHTLYNKEEPLTTFTNKSVKAILIVDDSPLIVKSLTELLEDVTAITSIHSCGTYNEAIDLLPHHNPGAVLLDINLPDKSGIVLLKYIKTFYPEIVVIMVTNQSEDFYKNLCLEMGASYFLDKSKDFEMLPEIIASII